MARAGARAEDRPQAAAARYPAMEAEPAVLVTARNEADRLPATLAALAEAFPGGRIVVADDASTDATVEVAAEAGAEVVRAPRRLGKGGAATLGAERLLRGRSDEQRPGLVGSAPGAIAAPGRVAPEPVAERLVVLCDGDLGSSATELSRLVDAVERGEGDLAVAGFARRVGGGLGVALAASRRTIRARTGLAPAAPLSGQRAMRSAVLRAVVPFAAGFGMETAMTIDAHRAGFRLVEVELPLEHRATGRTAAGFWHRGRQLVDIARVYASRR
jgi:glycosyltransferase involved in cell wall biosynthesis